MIQHLTQKQIDDYCRQRLRVEQLLPVSDHLAECNACRRQIESAMNTDAAFFALRSEVFGESADIFSPHTARAHLTAQQVAGHVDRKLSGEGLQTVADHLTNCEPCALAVDDLRAFRNQIATSLEREYNPATVHSPAEGFWHRAVALLPALFQGTPLFKSSPVMDLGAALAFGAALSILLLAVTGWLIWPPPREREPEQAVVVVPTPAPQPATVPVVAQLNDGQGQMTLDQEGKLSGADDLPVAYQRMVKEALITRRIEGSSQLKGLARPPSSLMSADKERSEFSVVEPVGKVVMSDQPTFRWTPIEGARGYVVEVYDSKFNPAATSPQLTKQSWRPPTLLRGKVYCWQVKAIKEGQEITSPRPPAPQARFRILDRAKANELAKARRAYPSSHLVLGLLYGEAGLLKEAEAELRALERANPDSEIARRLLRQIQALRRGSE